MSASEPRKDLAEGLNKLGESMQSMIELSALALGGALRSLEGENGGTVESVFTLDRELYGLKQEVVKACVEILALHAPVARDLRTITADLEIASDLDRVGRYSKDIAEIVRDLPKRSASAFVAVPSLREMGELTRRMFAKVTTAYLHRDAEAVRDIEEDDNAVDALHEQIFRTLVGRIADQTLSPGTGASLILVNRYLERLADHAVNVGGHVEYMVSGVRRRW